MSTPFARLGGETAVDADMESLNEIAQESGVTDVRIAEVVGIAASMDDDGLQR